MAIYYLCNWSGPSGGIKVLYDHVRVLRASGFDACLGAMGRFERCIWFQHERAEIPGRDRVLEVAGPADWIVVPDILMTDPSVLASPARKVAFIQNHGLVPSGAVLQGFERILVPSRPIERWVQRHPGFRRPVDVVEGFLERELVRPPRRWPGGPLRVLITPRPDKNRGEPAMAAEALAALGIARTITTRLMLRRDFVRLFRCHSLYLHLSYPEGFPGPVLEAFGAGCLVGGFAGFGGHHLMRHGRNCLLVEDGNWKQAVELAGELQRSGPRAQDDLLAGARETALLYNEHRLRLRLEAAFASVGRSRNVDR